MRKRISLYMLPVLITLFEPCAGQDNIAAASVEIKHEVKYVKSSSVPNSISRTLKQDSKGNIWVASFDGVFRYDGKSFTKVTDKVSSGRFFSILEDRKGNFWFSSVGEGVYQYDGKSFKQYTNADGLADDRVTDISEDKAGNVWFATDSGLSRFDGTSFSNFLTQSFQKFELKDAPASNNDTATTIKKPLRPIPSFRTPERDINNDINSIVEDKTGKFWVGTRGNAFIYDGKTFDSFPHGSSFMNVRCIIEDRKGNIWLGGRDGLWRYDGSAYTKFCDDFVGYVYEDRNGNIWTSSFTSRGWLISRYEAQALLNKSSVVTEIGLGYSDNRGMTFGILEATDGSIWFGALSGVYRYEGSTITHFKRQE